ncbi:hypothetical protein L3Q82_021974 [Scortum barcoo]|uniref:Uncharacterized protein n=1 Tax=Scortum barcoo TaxID=214431 RepID=A0ACB8X2A1_9TELE|nr:hypothetical protein L3Q82_021974 [Scortum barcoo]
MPSGPAAFLASAVVGGCTPDTPADAGITNISKDITVNEGSDVNLMCLAVGRPEANIIWKHHSPRGFGDTAGTSGTDAATDRGSVQQPTTFSVNP